MILKLLNNYLLFHLQLMEVFFSDFQFILIIDLICILTESDILFWELLNNKLEKLELKEK